MPTLSLDLRGQRRSLDLPSESSPGKSASVSLLAHGAFVAAMILAPLLSATAPPEVGETFQDVLIKPVIVSLPQGPPRVSARQRATAQRPPARALVEDLTAPRDIPTTVSASDVQDVAPGLAFDAGLSDTGEVGPGVPGGCVIGALCGTDARPAADPRPVETVRIGGLIKEPKLIESRAPVYPPLAQAVGASGRVIVEAHVGEDGRVRDVRVVAGHNLFNEAAVESVRSRRYDPLLLNGVRHDFLVTITVAFSIRR